MIKKIFIMIFIFQLSLIFPKTLYREKKYQDFFAKELNSVDTEVVLDDKARIDILTDEYAIIDIDRNYYNRKHKKKCNYNPKTPKTPPCKINL